MSNKFKEELKVTKLFDDETLELIKKENEKKENVNEDEYEFSRPLGGKKMAYDMSHLVSEERMDELFRTIVLGEDEER